MRLQGAERHEGAVRGGVDRIAGEAPRQRAGHDAGRGRAGAQRPQPGHDGVEDRDVEDRALAGSLAPEERRQDLQGGQRPPGHVGDLDARRDGARPGRPEQRQEAADGEVVEVVARPVPVGAHLPVPRQGAVDDPGVHGPDRRLAEPPSGKLARHRRLEEDIRRRREAQHDLPAPREPVVDRDAPLAAIDGLEEAAEPELGRRHPGVVAGQRRLDLDDLRAEVGKEERAPRAGQQPGEIQDADPRERTAQARRCSRLGQRVSRRRRPRRPGRTTKKWLVGVVGFEPTTSCSQSTCATTALHPDRFRAHEAHVLPVLGRSRLAFAARIAYAGRLLDPAAPERPYGTSPPAAAHVIRPPPISPRSSRPGGATSRAQRMSPATISTYWPRSVAQLARFLESAGQCRRAAAGDPPRARRGVHHRPPRAVEAGNGPQPLPRLSGASSAGSSRRARFASTRWHRMKPPRLPEEPPPVLREAELPGDSRGVRAGQDVRRTTG